MCTRFAPVLRCFFSFALIVFLVFDLGIQIGVTPVRAEASPSISGTVGKRPLSAPVAGVTLNAPPNLFIGDPLTFTVTFDNTGPDTGYGPYIDLFLPLSGADGLSGGGPNDGISFVSATYLGLPVTTNVLNCPAGSSVTHPLTGQNITCPAQPSGLYSPFTWQLVVITLPFGSFVPAQPPATVTVNANLSNYADLGTALPIQAQGGFMFGADPLDNPATDPPIVGSTVSTNVTPMLLTLTKSYNGPEDETATGPNFPRRYTVTAQIAPGQTMTAFNLTDVLPNNMQFVSLVSTNPSGASCTLPSTSTPGGTLSCDFASVSGTVTMTFEYYIPLRDSASASVIDPASGDDVISCNNASGGGTWSPLDARDTGGTFTQDPPGCEHTLTDKSIAIQKSVAVVGGGIPKPGAVLEYTLSFQVSDFFAFQNISITDIISDGQRFDSSFTPTMQINGNNYVLPAAGMNANNVGVVCNYTGGPGPECDSDNPAANDGTTTITFDVSPEIIARGQDGRLIGGCVPTSGTGGGDPSCSSYNDGPTTGTIIFRTIVQENFSDTYPSGDSSVDQGDVLNDTVTISGDLLSTSDASTPTGQSEADNSAASVSIPRGTISKSIYALNGSTLFSTPVLIAPGDTVTYRITYTLPTSDFEDLVITDYLPLPIFDATEVTTFTNGICGVPPAGVSCLGPSDTYHLLSGAGTLPTLSTSSAANSITWTYGDYDAPNNPSSTIDLLFTVTVKNDPFADGLYLTNQANAREGSTNASDSTSDAIIQVQLQEPVVGISKGVVWTNNPAGVFSPSTVGPVTFTGSGCPAFSGTITSPGLTANPVNSNLSGVDAGDQVMMAIILENTGRYSAFDVRVRDSLPTGMTLVPGSVCVTDGTGAPISTTDLGGGLFGSGLELDDPGPTNPPAGALDPGKNPDGSLVSTGRNIAVITYLVTLDASVKASQTLTNTAILLNYAGTEGGPNHVPGGRQDKAEVTIAKPSLTKALTSTNQTFTSGSNVAVGEKVTYTITITVPEGVTPNAVFSDTLDPGLAFVSCDSITASSSISATGGLNCANATFSNNAGGVMEAGEANARVLTYNFGNITNTDTDNTTTETITIQYTAVVLNSASINRGWVRSNYAGLFWTGGNQAASPTSVTVVEPTLQVNKTASPTSGDAGDIITYTAVIFHTGASNADAFEARLLDDLSALPVTLDLGSIAVIPSGCTPAVTNNSTASVVNLILTPFPLGCSVTVTYQVTLNNTVFPGQIITNTANLDWTSLPGDVSTPQTPNNTLSCERTGNVSGCGGTNNDYVASDPATVTVNVTPIKSIVATSEASTGPQGTPPTQRLVIGEIVRYRLQVQWPEGTALNAMLRDNLPTGLQFLNDNTAKVAFVCNSSATCMSSSNPLIGSSPVVSGNETTVGSITPSFVLPDDAVSASPTSNNDSYGSGTDPYFKFGDLLNNDNDPDQEFVVVEFNALVLNINSNRSGMNRGNSFSVLVGGIVRATSATVRITIAEPTLGLTKVVTTAPTDAGDSVVYTLTITNTSSGVNRATAFDLNLSDVLDPYLVPGVVVINSTQGAICVGPSGSGTTTFTTGSSVIGQTVTVTATCLDPGQSITVTINATVVATAPAGYTIPNTANVTFTSLPGTNGASSNPTGSVTPGASGSGTGERNGQDGVGGALNDYAATASVNTPLAIPAIDKRPATPASAPIGGTVTFPILVTLPEGVTQNLVVTDNLPVGLVYVSHSVVTTAASSGGLLAADYNGTLPTPTVTAPGGSGGNLTLDFGNVTTTADNDATNNAFVIFVTARVNNELGNQNGTTLPNTASLTYNDPDTGTTTIADPTAENVTVLEPELDIQKSADDTTPAYGQTLTYTLTVSHLASSTSTAYDIVVTDTIPSGLTYVAGSISAPAGWTTSDAGAPTLTWTCSNPCSLPVGNTASLSYQVTVNGPPGPPNPGDVLTNTASMTWTSLDGTDPNERTGADGVGGLNNYTDSDPENVTLTYPDLTITKTDGQTTYVPGAPVIYTIVVSNVGNGDAIGATVSDNILPPITSWSWVCTTQTGGASGCDPYSGNGNFSDVVNLPAGASITYTVTAQTDPAATGNLDNTVTVTPPSGFTDPTPDDNIARDSDTPDPQADLSVTKDDGVLTYIPGGTVTYTITVTNNGPSDAPGAVITDNIPSQFTYWSWVCSTLSGGASGCDSYSGSGNFSDTINLPAGASITYTVTANIASSATGDLTNTVTVAPPSGVTDPNSGNDTASDTDTQNSVADLYVTKTDGQPTYTPGVGLTYTVVVGNNGPSDVSGVVISDTRPAQVTSWTWTCAGTTGGASGCDDDNTNPTTFTDTVDLPAGSSITYSVTVVIPSSATGDLVNTVSVTPPTGVTDPNSGNDTASDTDTQNSVADLYVTKTDGQLTYTPGVGLTYTVVVGNNGPSDVSGVVISDTRPAQVTSWTWTCAGTTGGASGCDDDNTNPTTFTDTVDLPAGSSITYSVTVVIPSSATGNLVNTVSVTLPTGVTDPNSSNNTVTDTDEQNSQAAISVTKDDGVTEYVPGSTLTYTITVTNNGPSDALGVSVTDNIPSQFTSWTWTCVSSSGGASGCDDFGPGNANFTDNIDLAGPFPSSITYQVVAQVASSATGNLNNTVTISHPADTDLDDNTASDTDTPNPQADLSVTKDDGVTVVAPNSTITYTITVTNNGPSDANGVTVSDPKPSQIDTWTWTCAPSGGATCSGSGGPITTDFSEVVNLPAGSSITYTVTAHIAASATSGTLTNIVTVTPPAGVTDPDPSDNSDDDEDQVVAQPSGDLTKSLIATNQGFTPDPSVAIGEILTYRVTFTVPAGGTMHNLTLTDTLDRGLAFVDCVSIIPSDPETITTNLSGGFAAACNDPTNPTVATEPPGSTNPADAGRKITFNLGNVSNSGTSNGTVSVQYTVVVLNSIENQDGVSLNNSATLTWDSGTLSTAAPNVTIVEPDFELLKEADRTVATPGSVITFTLTFRHTTASNVDAFDVVLTDVLPSGLTYVPGSLTIVSGPPGGVPDDSAAPTLRVTWASFPLLTGSSRTEAVVRFQAVLGNLAPGQRVRNTASLEWTSLPGDVSSPQSSYNNLSTERYYDPGSDVNVYGVFSSVTINVPRLPATGFAPGVITSIPAQPADKAYTDLGNFWLEIPKLGVKMPIVGVPAKGEEWDLTWLWDQAGWLEGTAYPTHAGNSAITAHVYLPNGQPGPFYSLDALRFGDAVIVHLGGQRYVFEVRQVQRVSPNTLSALRHEELPWLTLITCREYDPKTNSYRSRLIVRAVLVKILE